MESAWPMIMRQPLAPLTLITCTAPPSQCRSVPWPAALAESQWPPGAWFAPALGVKQALLLSEHQSNRRCRAGTASGCAGEAASGTVRCSMAGRTLGQRYRTLNV